MIKVQFKVEAGPHAGRTLFTNFVLSPDSAFALTIFFRNMAALGFDDNYFAQLSESGLDVKASMVTIAGALEGRKARVEVGTRVWQGQERNEVTNMTAPLGGASSASVGLPGVAGGPAIPAGLGSVAGGPPVPPASFGSSFVPPTPPEAPFATPPTTVTTQLEATWPETPTTSAATNTTAPPAVPF